jgi:hypothetical protein
VIAKHVDKKVTNLEIAGKNQPTMTKGHPIGRVKIHQRRHIYKHQMPKIIVIIATNLATVKIDATK